MVKTLRRVRRSRRRVKPRLKSRKRFLRKSRVKRRVPLKKTFKPMRRRKDFQPLALTSRIFSGHTLPERTYCRLRWWSVYKIYMPIMPYIVNYSALPATVQSGAISPSALHDSMLWDYQRTMLMNVLPGFAPVDLKQNFPRFGPLLADPVTAGAHGPTEGSFMRTVPYWGLLSSLYKKYRVFSSRVTLKIRPTTSMTNPWPHATGFQGLIATGTPGDLEVDPRLVPRLTSLDRVEIEATHGQINGESLPGGIVGPSMAPGYIDDDEAPIPGQTLPSGTVRAQGPYNPVVHAFAPTPVFRRGYWYVRAFYYENDQPKTESPQTIGYHTLLSPNATIPPATLNAGPTIDVGSCVEIPSDSSGYQRYPAIWQSERDFRSDETVMWVSDKIGSSDYRTLTVPLARYGVNAGPYNGATMTALLPYGAGPSNSAMSYQSLPTVGMSIKVGKKGVRLVGNFNWRKMKLQDHRDYPVLDTDADGAYVPSDLPKNCRFYIKWGYISFSEDGRYCSHKTQSNVQDFSVYHTHSYGVQLSEPITTPDSAPGQGSIKIENMSAAQRSELFEKVRFGDSVEDLAMDDDEDDDDDDDEAIEDDIQVV